MMSTTHKYKPLLANIQNNFQKSNNYLHKARNEIKIIDFNDEKLAVKSFRVPNFLNKIIYTFLRDSKSKKSYNNSIKINQFVPAPIGFIEFKKFGLLHNSYYVSEKFNYDFTIRELLFDNNFKDKKLILKLFAKFTSELHCNGIYHLDYSPGNILIKKDNDSYIFKIVDVNRMKFIDFDLDTRAKNFSRIWLNDNDLEYIALEYCKLTNIDSELFIPIALKYSQKHKARTELKKRLKK